jgi:hypothetical protein
MLLFLVAYAQLDAELPKSIASKGKILLINDLARLNSRKNVLTPRPDCALLILTPPAGRSC